MRTSPCSRTTPRERVERLRADSFDGWEWECAATSPGVAADPAQLGAADLAWISAAVPGTAAGALRAHGTWGAGEDDAEILDGQDWWFRCRFADPGAGPYTLHFGGLATLADVWLNGSHLLRSDNMFLEHACEIDGLESENELCIRFAALEPELARKRPRPRWKTALARRPNFRWIRTTLLGRMDGWAGWAAPVGPWRPIELVARPARRVVTSSINTECEGPGGSVHVRATIESSGAAPTSAHIRVGDEIAPLRWSANGTRLTVDGTLILPEVERWWPHTHGGQTRYRVLLEIGDDTIELATVGFRTVEVDRTGDGFQFVVNVAPIFCRGAVWVPPDVVTFTADRDAVRASLERFRDTGMNMVRIAGHSVYESADFWDLCDELGVMVWQDCMLAGFDPPEDDDFARAIVAETTQVLSALQGRPALALVCGSSETYQRAAMFGLAPDSWKSTVLEATIPAVVERVLPGITYIASSPIGGVLPFEPAVGVAHYFGVGAYERPLSDARASGVRFAAECLAFAIPPEPGQGTDDPNAAVPRDPGALWDFADVRDFYVRSLFDVDPDVVLTTDRSFALDLGRAAVAEAMSAAMSEWRHPGSQCAGGLVLAWQDLWPGAGWGLLDRAGRPKAPWYALKRVLDPLALLVTDEGLSGLMIHVVNDHPHPFRGELRIGAYAEDGLCVEDATQAVALAARSSASISASALLGGFRDLTRAYRFGPPAHDVIELTLLSDGDEPRRDTCYLPLGRARPRLDDVGLRATAARDASGEWSLTITTTSFAQWVAIDVPGYEPSDSWFHLAPGSARTITLRADDPDRGSNGDPVGEVRALNSRARSPISFDR
jgi:beta-mannosidase